MTEPHGPEHLHAPWRMEYVKTTDKPKTGCVFCEMPGEDSDEKNLIVYRGERCYVILNAFPYNGGHLMIIPFQHTPELGDLPTETQLEMVRLTTLAINALRRAMNPDGFNLGMNLGRAGGAGIAEHVHMHVVPRWLGDTNFMTAVGNTRVLPESLECSWKKISAAFHELVVGDNI